MNNVKLRTKALADGRKSLYLDYYFEDGSRKYEFLGLYLEKDTRTNKKKNKEILEQANEILLNRILKSTKKEKTLSLMELALKKRDDMEGGTRSSYSAVIYLISKLNIGDTSIEDINKEFCIDVLKKIDKYKSCVRGKIIKSSYKWTLCAMLRGIIAYAVNQGYIEENPFKSIDVKKYLEKKIIKERCYLTEDEIEMLINTKYNENVKNMFLFSCFTGLRVSDVMKLRWENIICNGDKMHIDITIQKTQKRAIIPIIDMAKKYLPKRGSGCVFEQIGTSCIRRYIARWCEKAGITKHVTFHTARHTFATLLVTKDVPIQIISELLGHSNIKTTQIYAKVIDRKKEEAIKKLDSLF